MVRLKLKETAEAKHIVKAGKQFRVTLIDRIIILIDSSYAMTR